MTDFVEINLHRMGKEELLGKLTSSNVILLPFKIVFSDMPLSVLEALSVGVPVITTSLDGLPELVDEGRGLLIPPSNARELARGMTLLYRNPNLGREMSRKAIEYTIKHPSWDQVSGEVKKILLDSSLHQTNT